MACWLVAKMTSRVMFRRCDMPRIYIQDGDAVVEAADRRMAVIDEREAKIVAEIEAMSGWI